MMKKDRRYLGRRKHITLKEKNRNRYYQKQDEYSEKNRQRYHQNKEIQTKKIECECGGHYGNGHKLRHFKTKKHQAYLQQKDHIISKTKYYFYITLYMTANLENIDKFSHLGLRRRPTYEEVIGLLDENKTITGKSPNRDATFFKSSPEGSYFDGVDAMEQLKEEEGRMLLRQMSGILLRPNARTAGRTFHTTRFQQLPSTSPVIAQPSQSMDVEEEPPNQPTQAPPSSRMTQASQMNLELEQRRSQAMKRKEETTMNHRGEVFKQSKPTIAEQLLNIQPPRVIPENVPKFSSGDEALKKPERNSINIFKSSSNGCIQQT